MIRLIAIDLDGTLLNSKKVIPEENIKAIQEATANGIKIVLCTGRPKNGTKPYFDQLGLVEDEFLILNNGCSTYTSIEWNLIHHYHLTIEQVKHLEKLSRHFDGVALTLTTEDNYYVIGEQVPDIVAADGELVFTKVKTTTIEALEQGSEIIFQAMYMGTSQAMDAFEDAMRSQLVEDFSVVRSQDYILEVMPKHVTKAHALKDLAEDLNCTANEVMAIGDAPNDIEMLSFAGTGVAMGNASESIKVLADHITSHCDQAGVAQAIRKYALNQ
ncbi:Cof-type HAD-IIB family hydrolase [Streptococcus hongkongensis]|nr:haloacid dehalogenase [Streptococcus uberis]